MNQVFNILTNGDADATLQVLSIRVGERHFGFAISNRETNELIQLTWYVASENGYLELDEVYDRHPELRKRFHQVMIGYDHPRSLLVPPDSYKNGDPGLLLDIMYGVNGRNIIITENITGWQLQNIYAIPADVMEWMQKRFPAGEYRHNYSIGIRQIKAGEEQSLVLDFRAQDFSLVASKESRLLLVQTFPYSTPADVIYYLVKICQEFSLQQETVRLSVSGLVEKESSLYRELAQYFLHIHFREPAWQMNSTGEQEYPSHFFTSLNDLALCAS